MVSFLLGFALAVFGLAGRRLLGRPHLPSRRPAPLARVRVAKEDGMYLEVTNGGARADFEAQLELTSGRDKVHERDAAVDFQGYAGYWERSHGPVATLGAGDMDRLVIGRLEAGPADLPPATLFKMAFYDPAQRRYAEYATTGWLADVAAIDPPRLELRVTIDSSPRSPSGPYVNTFVVDGEDPQALRDVKPFNNRSGGITVRHY